MDADQPMRRQRLSADLRRQQIADTALRLIASEGAARLTASHLAEAVGVSDAALFRHFGSMADIVLAAVAQFGELLAASLADMPEAPTARLEKFFCHRLRLVSSRPEVMQLAFNERLADAADAAGAQLVRQHLAASRQFLQHCLAQGQATGEFRRDVQVQALVWTVTGHMRGAASALAGQAEGTVQEKILHVWKDLLTLIKE